MKKTLAILVVICIIITITLTSCAGSLKKDLEEASAKMRTVDKYCITTVLKTSIKYGGEVYPTTMTYKNKIIDATTDKIKGESTVEIEENGEKAVGYLYTDGEWNYVIMGEEKYKVRPEDSEDTPISKIPSGLLNRAEVTDKDGSRTVKINIDGKQFKELYPSMVEYLLDGYGFKTLFEDAVIYRAYMTIVIDAHGYISDIEVGFNARVTYDYYTYELTYFDKETYSDLNGDITVTFPEGYLDFEEFKDPSDSEI